ncbi:unnamed protein product, partial [Ectocarpus sp. 12 AP-2014]
GLLLSGLVSGHVVCSYVRVDRVRACSERVSKVVRRELAKTQAPEAVHSQDCADVVQALGSRREGLRIVVFRTQPSDYRYREGQRHQAHHAPLPVCTHVAYAGRQNVDGKSTPDSTFGDQTIVRKSGA